MSWTGTDRYLPINYVPRWLNANYSVDSKLRKIYALGPVYYREQMLRLGTLDFQPNFWAETWQPRSAYVAKYTYPKGYIPKITVFANSNYLANTEVLMVSTYGSFLYENTRAVAYQDRDKLLFRNLSLVSFSVNVSSGYLDLSTPLATHSILEDSYYLVIDPYGEETYYDQNDPNITSSGIPVKVDGSYQIRYLAKDLHQSFLSGVGYALIDDTQIYLSGHQLANSWDEYGSWLGLYRRDNETNISLKTRCQHSTLANNPESLISAALGQTRLIIWATSSSLSLTGSGFVRAELFDKSKVLYVSENPAKLGSNFALRYEPDSLVQVFLRGTALSATSYTLSGNLIVPTYNNLALAASEDVLVKYKTSTYTEVSSDNYLTSISRSSEGKELAWVVGTKNVRLQTAVKKIREWRWDREVNVASGTANFN